VVIEATIVDARDRELEEALRGSSARIRNMPASGLASLAHPTSAQPGVVILDLRGGRAFPPGLGALKRNHPATPVVIVTSGADPAVLLEAVRSGVNEVVTEPISSAELQEALARLTAHKSTRGEGQVFAFVGGKGGVGTTTAAVNVAAALAGSESGTTLLIDLHLAHGDAAVFLGAEPRFSVVDALENTHRFDESFFRGLVTPTSAGVDLLASSDHPLVHATSTDRVRTLIEFAAGLYRYTVLDVPRSDPATLDALAHVNKVVVVANQELATVKSASRIAAVLRQRYGKDRVGVIVSRYDRESDIGFEDIERVVGTKLSHTVPSDYRAALQALNRGRPLALTNHNRLAASYVSIARELAGLKDAGPSTDDGAGLFGWLKGRRNA
jgi:pilus assembly protein CpaE